MTGVLLLGGCAVFYPEVREVEGWYICDNREDVYVDTSLMSDGVVLTIRGQKFPMQKDNTITTMGRYTAGDGIVWWDRGATAFLEVDNRLFYHQCMPKRDYRKLPRKKDAMDLMTIF